jgi:hypothetical protein
MADRAPAVARLAALAIDCAEPERLCRWWQGLLGGEVEVDEDGDASLIAAGLPRLDFLRVPEPKTVKDRLHLDLRTSDLAAAEGASPRPRPSRPSPRTAPAPAARRARRSRRSRAAAPCPSVHRPDPGVTIRRRG